MKTRVCLTKEDKENVIKSLRRGEMQCSIAQRYDMSLSAVSKYNKARGGKPVRELGIVFCTECEKISPDYAKFCANCGKDLKPVDQYLVTSVGLQDIAGEYENTLTDKELQIILNAINLLNNHVGEY